MKERWAERELLWNALSESPENAHPVSDGYFMDTQVEARKCASASPQWGGVLRPPDIYPKNNPQTDGSLSSATWPVGGFFGFWS